MWRRKGRRWYGRLWRRRWVWRWRGRRMRWRRRWRRRRRWRWRGGWWDSGRGERDTVPPIRPCGWCGVVSCPCEAVHFRRVPVRHLFVDAELGGRIILHKSRAVRHAAARDDAGQIEVNRRVPRVAQLLGENVARASENLARVALPALSHGRLGVNVILCANAGPKRPLDERRAA